MARTAVIVVGSNAAQSDYEAAQELKRHLKYLRVKIKQDSQFNIIDALFRDVYCIGGPKVNRISARYSTIVTGPRIEVYGNDVYIRDQYGRTCFKNDYKRHVGIISSGQKTMFSKVVIIAGLDRIGTIGAVRTYIETNGKTNIITFADNEGNPTGYTDRCGGRFIKL